MRLAVQSAGTGSRTALLIHGIMSDHRAWHDVSARLESNGYRVVTVDLAGHGASDRSQRYSIASWADDVVESVVPVVEAPIDLIVGHSLGALVAGHALERLGARAAVYVDPAFAFPRGPYGVGMKAMFALAPRPRRSALRRWNPKWSETDLDIEMATLAVWDKRTLWGLADTRQFAPPAADLAPSLVILAERSFLITDAVARRLRETGFSVATIPGTGHTVFRDEPELFAQGLVGWLMREVGPT